ncbi:Transcription factor iws1 [Blastocladiella emersonii ATCC 22665]|nr:Transcription factor iws1 [Blastocladiella emersonii ATCC 22665]
MDDSMHYDDADAPRPSDGDAPEAQPAPAPPATGVLPPPPPANIFEAFAEFGGDDESELSEVDLEEEDIPLPGPTPALAEPEPSRRPPVEAYDDEDEYEGEDLGDGTRRKKRKTTKAAKPAAQRLGPLPAGIDEDAAARILDVRKSLDNVVKTTSKTRKRKRDMDLTEAEELVRSVRERMKQAAQHDMDAHQRKELAVHKLQMLPILEREMGRADMQEHFLDHHILEGFMAWLEPLPDGSLPLFDIRKTLFAMLQKLPIATDHLREDRIGPLVAFYAKCPRETPEIRRIAQECITKWSRPILNLSDSYRDVRVEQRSVDLAQLRSRRVLPRSSQAGNAVDGSQGPAASSSQDPGATPGRRARVPLPRAAGYMVRPASNVSAAAAAGVGEGGKKKKKEMRANDRALLKMRTGK